MNAKLGRSFARALDAVRDAVLVVDAQGRIVFANQAVTVVFGYEPPKLLGQSIETLIPQAARAHHAQLRQAYAAAPVVRPMGEGLQLSGLRRDGSVFPADVSLAPLRTDRAVLLTAVVRDLSLKQPGHATRQAAEHLSQQTRHGADRFRLTIHQARRAMLILGARPGHEGAILEVNRAFCDLLCRAEADLLGRPAEQVFGPDTDIREPVDLHHSILTTGRNTAAGVEWQVRHTDGHPIWVSLGGVLVHDEENKPDYVFVHHIVDVTDLRAARRQAARRGERDRRIATVLQQGLQPTVPPRVGPVRVTGRYRPADGGATVGGDWYDVFPLSNGRVGLTVGDVAGHGIEAAVTMSRLRHAARVLAADAASPATVVTRLNELMHRDDQPADEIDFATLVYAQIDPGTGTVVYCSAGHLPLLTLTPAPPPPDPSHPRDQPTRPAPAIGPRVQPLAELGGPPIGVTPGLEYTEHHAALTPDARLVGFTDGLIEKRGQAITDSLEELLANLHALPLHTIRDVELLAEKIIEVAPNQTHTDDTAVIVLARHDPAMPPDPS